MKISNSFETKYTFSKNYNIAERNKNSCNVQRGAFIESSPSFRANIINKTTKVVTKNTTRKLAGIAGLVSFFTSILNGSNKQKEEFSESEIKALKCKLEEQGIKNINKYKILVAGKILNDKKLSGCKNVKKNFVDLVKNLKTKEQYEVVSKILSNKILYKNENIMRNINEIIRRTDSPESAKFKMSFLDKTIANKNLWYNEIFKNQSGTVLSCTFSQDLVDTAFEIFQDANVTKNESKMNNIMKILYCTNFHNATDFGVKLLSDEKLYNNTILINNLSKILFSTSKEHLEFLKTKDISSISDSINYQHKIVLRTPEKYVDEEDLTEDEIKDEVEDFFTQLISYSLVLPAIFDKEAFNNLLRMRFDSAYDYINVLKNFTASELELLSKMQNCVNQDNKPFMPTQKIEFIDLIYSYKTNGIDLTAIRDMVNTGQIDLGKLELELFRKVLLNVALDDKEISKIPKDKLMSWDMKYIHFLAQEINESPRGIFRDILRAGILEPDFMRHIHDETNVYGETNAETKSRFTLEGLNYNKWINPSKDLKMNFSIKDKNTDSLSQIAEQIVKDMQKLRQGPVKSFIDRQLPHCIKEDKFFIPPKVMTSKARLKEFVNNIIKQLNSVWIRAQSNTANPDSNIRQSSKNTLTVLDHLKQRIEDISQITNDKSIKSLDWTIKMWDRIPQKDLFQGNYSTCCIGMGRGNGSAMPHYIMNTAFNMIEFVDNTTGKIVGNALCYFADKEDGKPAFIIDNVEIANSAKPSNEVGLKLRDMLIEYASRITKEVTGSDNIPIYLGPDNNDIPDNDFCTIVEEMNFLGDIDCEEIYLDVFEGWISRQNLTQEVELLKFK